MTRKNRIISLGLAATVLAGIIAAAPAMAKTKITVWLGTGYEWKTATDMFKKANPSIDVTLLGGELDKFYTMITAGLMPDVWGPWSTPGITADVNRNWALDLGPYIKRDGNAMNINDFFPGLMRQFKVRGKQYSLPIFSYTDWFFYNTEMWSQAGLQPPPIDAGDKNWNWEAMTAAALKTTKRSADGARLTQAGMEFSRDFWCTPNWVHLWGVKLYNDEAVKTSIPQDIDMNSPKMTTALNKMWDLIYKQKVVSAGGMSFSGNKTAASIEHGWNVFNFMQTKKMKWAVAPLPWAVTDSGTIWPDGLRIGRISKNKEAAWKYVKFMCSPAVMKMLATDPKSGRRGSAVARKSVFGETLGQEVGKVTGMNPNDVFKVHEQADEVGIVKESESICLHTDLSKQYIEPILTNFWANKIAPGQIAQTLDTSARKGMGILFARWMRNVKYTGAQL